MSKDQSGNHAKLVEHWNKSRNLMLTVLAIWAVFSFVIHVFVNQLNQITIFGFPFGFYMAAQGSLIIFVILIFWFASAQDKLDKQYGVQED